MLEFSGAFRFEAALLGLKMGGKIRNANWNGKNMYLEVQYPDSGSKNTEPYIVLVTANKRVPWTPSQLDIFSNAWQVGEETHSFGDAMKAVAEGKLAYRMGWEENKKRVQMVVMKSEEPGDTVDLAYFNGKEGEIVGRYVYRFPDYMAHDWVISAPF